MPKPNNCYSSIDDQAGPIASTDNIEWYWRVFAFVASWMILAGFVALQPLLDTNVDDFRISRTVLIALAISLLVSGFLISALVYFVCKTWRMRFDVVSLPGLSSSFLGLFALLFPLAVSSQFSASSTAGFAGVLVATLATSIYIIISGFTYYKSQRPLPLRNLLQPRSDQELDLHANTSYRRGSANVYGLDTYGEAPVTIIPAPPLNPEEEETREQMSRLLTRNVPTARPRDSQQSLSNTYHLDWPVEDQIHLTPARMAAIPRSFITTSSSSAGGGGLELPRHVQDYYFNDQQRLTHMGNTSMSTADASSPPVSLSNLTEPSAPFRTDGSSGTRSGFQVSPMVTPRIEPERLRSDSRDDRRREIEQGWNAETYGNS